MDFLKKFLKNDNTVVGLCDLKRRTTINSFGARQQFGFNLNYSNPSSSDIPGVLLYSK